MKILVTGGTGFVGSHSVAALSRAGHDIRMLVRSPDKVAASLAPHSVEVGDVVAGDVTDRDAVVRALDGCDAVLHAANVYSLDKRAVEGMRRVNTEGTEIVIGEAVKAGLDPIVHVSSYVALMPADGELVTRDTPTGNPASDYSQTKAAADRIARRYQSEDAPVVATYPGLVLGPDDPYLGESAKIVLNALNGKIPLANDGTLAVCDVRDVADVHAAVMEAGLGPRRYLATGHDVGFHEFIQLFANEAGRSVKVRKIPHAMATIAGRVGDFVARVLKRELALNYEGPWLVAHGGPTDSSPTTEELKVEFRPLAETAHDTVRWLRDAGHLE